MDSYEQKLEIVFSSETACAKARLEVLPLYHGAARAAMDSALKPGQEPASLSQALDLSQSLNRQFYEIAAARVDHESSLQAPTACFAYTFVSSGSASKDWKVKRSLYEILKRAGFYLVAGQADDGLMLGLESARPLSASAGSTWICSPGAYAAYRSQVTWYGVAVISDKASLFVTLTRADPADLEDMAPLSFAVKGVKASEVLRVRCDGAEPQRFEAGLGAYGFDLPHSAGKSIPSAIGAEAMGVEASLKREGDGLNLELKNTGEGRLENIRVAFRLPLKYSEGVVKNWAGSLEPGENKEVEIAVHEAGQDPSHVRPGL